MDVKKAKELSHLTSFLAAIAIQGVPMPIPDGAGPDFVVAADQGEVGIEVTELFRETLKQGISRRQMEGIREQVLAGAKKLWEEAGQPFLEAHVHFSEHQTPLKKSDISRVAAELVAFVGAHIPAVGEYLHFNWHDRRAVALPKEVHAISIIRPAFHTQSYWFNPDSDRGATLSVEQLQARITAKNGKAVAYRSAVGVVWLLLIMDGRRLSGWFELQGAVLEAVYESMFDRIFLFDRFPPTVRELAKRRPTSGAAV
ncbi:MAG TPA: hypothetical protein VGK74_08680 [Symbiobacteriaceae bacterium]|jgi:hypothetical protein